MRSRNIAAAVCGVFIALAAVAASSVPCSARSVLSTDKPVRILAIGNSFTVDAVEQYLYELFEAAGYEAVIGNIYIGGCTLEKHWKNESSDDPKLKNSNSYRKIVGGVRTVTKNVSIEHALRDEAWDYVIFQQGGGLYGKTESHYPYLDNFLAYVAGILEQGTYRTGYQQNWAFPKSCTAERFNFYDRDQEKMFRACMDCARDLKKKSSLDLIIPTGTAIQNGRQSFLGDTFNRDWGHLSYTYGRYTASCTWFEKISGLDVRENPYRPSTIDEGTARICRNAAHEAVMRPRRLTE